MDDVTHIVRRVGVAVALGVMMLAIAAPVALGYPLFEGERPDGPALVRDDPDGYQPEAGSPALPALVRTEPDGVRPAPAREPLQVANPYGGDGIDWGDAGVGAGIALGSVLLAAAAVVGLRRHGRIAAS